MWQWLLLTAVVECVVLYSLIWIQMIANVASISSWIGHSYQEVWVKFKIKLKAQTLKLFSEKFRNKLNLNETFHILLRNILSTIYLVILDPISSEKRKNLPSEKRFNQSPNKNIAMEIYHDRTPINIKKLFDDLSLTLIFLSRNRTDYKPFWDSDQEERSECFNKLARSWRLTLRAFSRKKKSAEKHKSLRKLFPHKEGKTW